MPKTTNARELFIEQLGDVLTAEKTVEKMLKTMRQQATDQKLTQRLGRHERETRDQIEKVQRVFQELGTRPRAKQCPGIEGISAELKEAREVNGAELTDLAILAASARTEHYEIAAYEGLVTMAKAMGESKAAGLLEQNLKQEQAMLRDGKTVTRRLAGRVAKAQDGATPARGGRRSSARASGARRTTARRSASTPKRR